MPRGPKGQKRPADVIPVKAAWLALLLGALSALGEGQKSESAGCQTPGRSRLGPL